jgi:hypothetical protein
MVGQKRHSFVLPLEVDLLLQSIGLMTNSDLTGCLRWRHFHVLHQDLTLVQLPTCSLHKLFFSMVQGHHFLVDFVFLDFAHDNDWMMMVLNVVLMSCCILQF